MKWLVAFALTLAPCTARANPLDAFGFGARSIGMGNAMTALAEDFSANYYNPAGLAAGGDLRLEFGYILVRPGMELNGGDQNVDDSRGFQGGVVLPGELLGHNVGFSVGLHLPDERVSRIRALPQRQPRWVLYDNHPQRIVISSSAAFEIVRGLYFGAGLTYLANTSGTLAMEGSVSISDAEKTRLLSEVDVNLAAVRYLSAGLLYTPSTRWRIGLTYREDFSLRLDLDVDVRGEIFLQTGDTERVLVDDARFLFNSKNDNLYSPRQVYLGVAHQCEWPRKHGLLLAFDLGWIDWSAFPTPTAQVRLDLDLGTLDFDVPLPDEPEDPNFHDTFLPRLGVEWMAVDGAQIGVALRAGYFYEASPVPDQPGVTNYVDADKHGFTSGFGLRISDLGEVFKKPFWLDVGFEYIHVAERIIAKDDPADPVGDYVARGDVVGVSSNLSFRF